MLRSLVGSEMCIRDSNAEYGIHGVLAFISFAHALLLLLLRSYRIPLINPMYAAQSVFLGLLACSQFIGSDEARTAFSVLFMVACGLAVVTCVIAAFLELSLIHI
eukprot:TRINITY_DN53936_c0_g1_i1.p1 TRINITY_DN53936_c0_g1~~TRINITY_DN53936_c0_g1_i1.p1  ORF type:complete len:105 (+),score=25.03 TRINITY_DN53936_c0_g1_i1:136-450(+)